MKHLLQFINPANTPQNTGGGTSHSSTVVTPAWKGSRPTVSRRSTDSQPKAHRTHTLLCKALKYAAMILMVMTLGVGNVWGDQTFTVQNPAASKRYVQDNITINGEPVSGTIKNTSSVSFHINSSGSYAPFFVISKAQNIKAIEFNGARNTNGATLTNAFTLKTSVDAITYSTPATGFTVELDNNGTKTYPTSLTNLQMVGKNQSYSTKMTITFDNPVMAVTLTPVAQTYIDKVVVTYDDEITPTAQLCEVHMTSTTAATLTGLGSWTTTNLQSGSTYTDTEATPNTYYYNKSSGTYGCINLGEGNEFQEGDEIWLDLGSGSRTTYTFLANNTNSTSGAVGIASAGMVCANGQTFAHYITKKTDPWVGEQTLYIMRGSSSGSNYRLYQISIHRAPACDPIGVAATGTATSVTYNSASLPFTMDKTDGVSKLTIEVFKNSDDTKVATYNNITPATSGSQTATGLDASTEYYYKITTVSAGGDFCDGATTAKSATFTTSAAPVANPVITAAVNEDGWGSVSPANITVSNGDAVSIDGAVLTCGGETLTATATTATAEYTYTFVNWTGVSNGDEITANITATANFSRTANSYAVNYTAPTNGSYTIKVGDASAVSANTTAAYGSTVTLAATPASGYRLAGWTVAKAVGTVTVTNNQFTMPAEAVTVSAAFEEIPCPTSGTVFSAVVAATSDQSFDATSTTELVANQVTITGAGGKAFAINGQGSAKKLIANSGGYKFCMTNNNTTFKYAIDCPIIVGDTIKAIYIGGAKDKSYDVLGLWVAVSNDRPASAPACNATASSGTNTMEYVVTKGSIYEGENELYFHRATGGSTYFNNVRIIRPAKYAVTFDKGDESATGEMSEQSVIEKSLVTLPACAFTAPTGKEFDAWVVTKTAGGASITVTDGKFTMPQEAVTLTATWKALTVKYAVTYNLGGASGDAPTETNKAEDDEFDLAAAPTWSGHVFQGWRWTDDESLNHLAEAGESFTMPAYTVTFTAQWKLDPNASMADAKYVIGGSALNMAAKYESSNTESSVSFSLKESYEGASITSAGSFTATAAGEYIVVAEQAGNATYANGSVEATVEVLESELSDIYIWNKNSSHGGSGKCVTSDQANQDINANQASTTLAYSTLTMEGMSAIGRPAAAGDVTLTFAVKNAYSSIFAIASVCAYGKIEEPGGIEYSWDNTNWTAVDGGESDNNKHEFEAPVGVYPSNFYIRFTNAETGKGGLWLRNALVTLEAKKAIVSTVIDLTDVKINGTSISEENLATLKTEPAYALDIEDEYVTAPTVKFNKHTVITYDDDSEVEKDDVITETAAVNLGGKWEASAEIDDITYTVTMAKADAFIVHYYQADGETLIGSENVAVSGHPTAAGITPTPQDYKRVVWTRGGEAVELEDVTSDVAGTEINLVASYVSVYARSINIEQWVLDNKVANKAGFIAELEGKGYKQVDLNALDSLNDDPSKTNRNYAFLGMKVNKATSAISFLLKSGSTVKARFGNMGNNVNVIIGEAEPVALTSEDYANTSVSSAKEYSYTAEADVIVKFQSTDTKTVVFKQIMIDEAIATVKLPAIVTYDANGGSFGKTSEKYTGTPLVIGDATPASEDYEFEGWHVGSVEGEKINAAAYEPTANVTLVAKYVVKPSPFSLSALTYQIGTGAATAVGYVEGTYEYDVELPYAPSYETITVAYTLADGTSSTKAGAVLNVTSVPGAATFTVIAANSTEKTYTVNFKKEAKDGLEIIGATVSGNTSANMSGLYGGTASVNLNSKKIDNGGYIYITLPSGYTFEETDVLVVDVHTKSDLSGGTKALEITTGVGNIDGEVWKTIAFDDYSTGNNTIALTGIAANQTSIGLKRSSNQNAKINSLKVYRPMNPVLKSITFDGTKIEVAGTTVEETLPYAADLTSVTPEIFWNGAGTAVVTTNAGAWAWGDNTYVLTDKDGDATTYTITLTRATRSSDKSLSSLTVDGNAVELKEGVYDYIYEYPYGTDPATVPVVAAEANDAHASVGTITQAASTAGTASFTVTAENETSQDYTVSFKISRVPGLVIYDGSTMTEIATSGSDVSTGFAWTMVGGKTDGAKSISVTLNGKTYTKAQNVFGSETTSTTRYIEITIPDGYLAKFYLAGATNSSGNLRSSYISKEKTGTLDESIAYASTDSYDGAAMYSALQLPGTYYYCSDNSIRLYELSVLLYPIDVARDVTPKTYGTICLPNGGIMVGATIFEVAHMTYENNQPYKVFFDEVIDGVMEAGMPYIFLPKDDVTSIAVTYTDEENASAGNHNGLYGTLDQMNGTQLYGKYIFYNNSIFMSENSANWLSANRAYIKLDEVPDCETAPAPGRRRVSMGFNGTNTATGLDAISQELKANSPKLIINGQLFILRGEKLYDATGRLVK